MDLLFEQLDWVIHVGRFWSVPEEALYEEDHLAWKTSEGFHRDGRGDDEDTHYREEDLGEVLSAFFITRTHTLYDGSTEEEQTSITLYPVGVVVRSEKDTPSSDVDFSRATGGLEVLIPFTCGVSCEKLRQFFKDILAHQGDPTFVIPVDLIQQVLETINIYHPDRLPYTTPGVRAGSIIMDEYETLREQRGSEPGSHLTISRVVGVDASETVILGLYSDGMIECRIEEEVSGVWNEPTAGLIRTQEHRESLRAYLQDVLTTSALIVLPEATDMLQPVRDFIQFLDR